MYNLHNSNDPTEYKYQASLFDASQELIESRKNNVYTFSFSKISELNNQLLWKRYGNDFKGVAIIFKIDNDIEKWNKFHISEIKYSANENIKQYVNDIKNLKIKYPECSFNLDLDRIMAFHKENCWENEKEVRILTHQKFQNVFEKMKFSKREFKIEPIRNRFTEYIELNLFVDNNSPHWLKYAVKPSGLEYLCQYNKRRKYAAHKSLSAVRDVP